MSYPHDAPAWIERFAAMRLPVLRATQAGVAYWAQREDDADAHRLADLVLRDPLMCVRVLTEVARRHGPRLTTPVETVTAALLLTGTEPFFRGFEGAPVLEDQLAEHPEALTGALAAIERSHRAARIAAAFAIHRQDERAEEVHQAALLHDFTTLLLWCEAPELALTIAWRQHRDPSLRTVAVQRDVLGTDLEPVAQVLMQRWHLPRSLRALSHPTGHADHGAPMVRLAVRIARHLDTGWSNPGLPDDLAEAGAMLNLLPYAAAQLVRHACD